MPNTSFSTFIHLVSIPVNRFVSEQSRLSSFSRGEEKNWTALRKAFYLLLERISRSNFGIIGQSILALFISIYAVNGFSIANNPQNIH